MAHPEGAEQNPGRPVRERLFVAADGGEVRGGVWLREQEFRAAGADVTCGWLKYPVAESLVDPAFNGVPASLLLHCLREQPRLLALGLGGLGTPLTRMLTRLGWSTSAVPFLFYVDRPAAVLREIEPLRRSVWRRGVARVLAATGTGWLAIRLAQRRRKPAELRRFPESVVTEMAEFGEWADGVWERTRDSYGFLAYRNRRTLEDLAPRTPDFQRLRVRRGGEDLGWVSVVRHDFSAGPPDPNFGRLTVGLIADGLSIPSHVADVLAAAVTWLRAARTDLIVTNQAHPAWVNALRSFGFMPGPSNFAFARAPAVERLLSSGPAVSACHMNRGDCDGPIWYGHA